MAVFYVQAASMLLKSWPTNASSRSNRGWKAAHLLTLAAAMIIFYDGPCAIKYVHTETAVFSRARNTHDAGEAHNKHNINIVLCLAIFKPHTLTHCIRSNHLIYFIALMLFLIS
jgi:hypothetical protein